MKLISFLFITIFGAAGCRSVDESWMPLESGSKWSYVARGEIASALTEISVSREIAVGDTKGKLLVGDFGESRLAWQNGILVASELAGTRYAPPLPLLNANNKVGQSTWRGVATNAAKSATVSSVMRQSRVPYTISQREVVATRTTILLNGPGIKEEITSWFVQGMGIVKQERRTSGKLIVSLSLISGP